ncbi:SCAN domain-containing protein 1 [Notamacropus eugenii]|uniref:SCAN domain-containing protein 1 n=1 Tax=Notamacropus eugenii TaxID=9315 RepID=UPI003B66FF1E
MAAEQGSTGRSIPATPEKEGASPLKLEESDAGPEASLPGPAPPSASPPSPVQLPAALEASPPAHGPPGARPGPETFRQRFRQFRYHEAAGPREAFRQLRELSRQWLRPEVRTKEQIVEMLVQEQLMAILPEEIRARRRGRRGDVRITG